MGGTVVAVAHSCRSASSSSSAPPRGRRPRTRLVNGFSDNTFRPNRPVSRQAFAAFLHRLMDKPWFPWED
jgi:hypothetical protein